jgi:predicted DNA-binding protein (MmcQ/YjbR family)
MPLHSPRSFRSYVSGLPAITLVEQWESHVAKVGGKVFALCGADGGNIVFKVTELSFEGLTELDGIGQAPYFAKRAWVSVGRGALPDRDLKAYIAQSHRMVAATLTRRLRTELGLSGP